MSRPRRGGVPCQLCYPTNNYATLHSSGAAAAAAAPQVEDLMPEPDPVVDDDDVCSSDSDEEGEEHLPELGAGAGSEAENNDEEEDSAEAILAVVNAIEEDEEAVEPLEHPLAPADDDAVDPNAEAPDAEAVTYCPDCGYEANKGKFKHKSKASKRFCTMSGAQHAHKYIGPHTHGQRAPAGYVYTPKTAASVRQEPAHAQFTATEWADFDESKHPTPPSSTAPERTTASNAYFTANPGISWTSPPIDIYETFVGTAKLGGVTKPLRECQAAWTKRHCEDQYVAETYGDKYQGHPDVERIKLVEAVYLSNGCTPRPSLRMTFIGDPFIVNQALVAALGSPTEAIHKIEQAKRTLRFQDPLASVPTSGEFKGDSAWKVRAIIEALRNCTERNFELGPVASLDEIVIGYTGRTGLSVRIKYKREGDGILLDAVCCPQTGALITFKLRADDTAQIEDPTNGDVSPTTVRCLSLLRKPCVGGKWRVIYMDNLFTSLKMAFYAFFFLRRPDHRCYTCRARLRRRGQTGRAEKEG